MRRGARADLHLRHQERTHRHHQPAQRSPQSRHPLLRPRYHPVFAGRHLRQPGEGIMNFRAVRAIYLFEMARTWRTLLQSIVSPVVSTSLYFVVFGAAIGSRITEVEGVSYGTFIVPMLVVTPLTFLGGSFYSVNMLPSGWRTITLLNPVVYLISGFRWSFYEIADVSVGVSVGITLMFLAICMVVVWWIFKTGYRLKN